MLKKNAKKRSSASVCLKHRWIKNKRVTIIINDLSTLNQIKAIHKMAVFTKVNKFKQAILQFMVNHFHLKIWRKKIKFNF